MQLRKQFVDLILFPVLVLDLDGIQLYENFQARFLSL